jgi:GNAT superfamily N-acetyltransferase
VTVSGVQVQPPHDEADLEAVRALMRGFVAWHRSRHEEDRHLVEAYFDDAAFDRELAELHRKYAPPEGGLLLARLDGVPVGCVALRRLDENTCEMKRMFVRPEAQRRGVGYALARAIIAMAVDAGYRAMVLDTSVRQREAVALYRRLGFTDVPAYYDLPEPLAKWLVFLRLELAAAPAGSASRNGSSGEAPEVH